MVKMLLIPQFLPSRDNISFAVTEVLGYHKATHHIVVLGPDSSEFSMYVILTFKNK